MTFQFKLPDIGEGVHEGEVVKWLVKEGDSVKEDQDIVEVMTDKATVQISSPRTGKIAKIHFGDGETVMVGQVLVEIDDGNNAESAETTERPATKAAKRDAGPAKTTAPSPAAVGGVKRTPFGVLAPPSVRIAARQRGIDLAQVKGSGPAGQVSMGDLTPPSSSSPSGLSPLASPSSAPDAPTVARDLSTRTEKVHFPLDSPSAHAGRAKRMSAHFSYVLAVPADKLADAVKRANVPAAAFVVRAVALALASHKRCNALVDERTGDLIVAREVNVGVARRKDDRLQIAVVRDAPKRTVQDIAKSVQAGGDKDTTATITVVSLGQYGPIAGTPVLIHPQVSVIMIGSVREVAVLKDGKAVPGHELTLSSSFDHRYVDGHEGAQFVSEVARLLEAPEKL